MKNIRGQVIAVLVVITVTMSGCYHLLDKYLDENHQEEGRYYIDSINADAGYYREYPSDGSMLYIKDRCYLYADTIAEDGCIQSSLIKAYEKMVMGLRYTGEWFFYKVETEEDSEYEIWKRNVTTGEEKKWYVGTHYLRSDIYHDYFFCEDGNDIWMCPIDGDPKTDSIVLNDLFTREDKSGRKQAVVYNGVFIRRRGYDDHASQYGSIDAVREKETGREILTFYRNESMIVVDGQMIFFSRNTLKNKRVFVYKWLGQRHVIDCLSEEVYRFANIYERYLTAEDGKVIGMLSATTWEGAYEEDQEDVIKDVLFWVDIYTGESGIYYDTVDNRTRIIGYQDGTIYLCRDSKVYSRSLESGEEQELLSMPAKKIYSFNWRGDYLIVRYSEKGEYRNWAVKVK